MLHDLREFLFSIHLIFVNISDFENILSCTFNISRHKSQYHVKIFIITTVVNLFMFINHLNEFEVLLVFNQLTEGLLV